jgi:hypothetical protein
MEASEQYESYWIAYFDLLGFKSVVRQPGNIACRLQQADGRPTIWYVLEQYKRAREAF